jgi:molybdopterin-guanine dinucleotide biosynthesis protein A
MNFSAVILAGGKSSRMGRDKAWLEVGEQTLLARQIQLAQAAGATEIFVSGRAGVVYPAFGGRVLEDKFQAAGPLAGIECALNAASEPLLLVLAVDMADLPSDFLKAISTRCRDGMGAVPLVKGMIEPLAAFYPRTAGSLIQKILAGANPAHSPGAKHFAAQCVQAGLARFITVPPEAAGWFKSWNSPEDLPAGLAGK